METKSTDQEVSEQWAKAKWWEIRKDCTHIYVGRWCPKRKNWHCRLLTTWRRRAPHNVLVEFEDGFRMVVPMRTLRKIKEAEDEHGK